MDYLKITSDLYDYVTNGAMKRSYMKDQKLNKNVLTNRSYSNYQTKSNSLYGQNSPESPSKKLELRQLINDCRKILKHYYKQGESTFYYAACTYLKVQWQSQKKNLDQHLNKISYLQQSIQMRNYSQIQSQVIKQWKKSPLLYSLRKIWYQQIVKVINSIPQFFKNYQIFAEFVGQLTFLYFKQFFVLLQKKTDIITLDKLTQRGAHLIITNSNQWCRLFDQNVKPLMKMQLSNYPVRLKNFNINSLQMPEHIISSEIQQNQLPQTTKMLQKFLIEYKLQDKIKILISIRTLLQSQILQKQKRLIEQGKIKSYKVLDKDDFISCLIYCIVKGQISIINLGVCLNYFGYIFGEYMSSILSQFGCSSYLTDIQAAVMYLVNVHNQYKIQDAELKKEEKKFKQSQIQQKTKQNIKKSTKIQKNLIKLF